MQKVIISGISGFIGSHLSCHLLKLYPQIEIFGLSRKKIQSKDDLSLNQLISCKHHQIDPNDYFKKITFIQCDLQKPSPLPNTLENSKCFFHCAAQIRTKNNAQEQYDINVHGTQFVVKEVQRLKIQSLLYMSSVAAHDPRFQHLTYFNSKSAAEKIVDQIPNKNILIPGIVMGAGDLLKDSRVSYKLFYKSPFPFSPSVNVSITDVHDLCEISIKLGFSQTFNNKFFVCPIHCNLLKMFKLYRLKSKFKYFPIFPFPELNFLKSKHVTTVNHVYLDNVPQEFRTHKPLSMENLVNESYESVQC